jgi:Flp pilus assembly protein TadB
MTPSDGMVVVAALAAAGAVVAVLPATRPVRLAHDRAAGGAPTGRREGADRHRAVRRAGVACAVSLAPLVLLGGLVGLVVASVAGVACWHWTGRLEPPAVRRRRERLAASVPHVVDLMAACLSAGMSPAAAVEQIGAAVPPPARDELVELSARLRLGLDPVTVWRDLAGHPELGALGRSVARAVESGASVSDAMQRLADDLRDRSRAEVENRARAVGVKAAVPLGVCLLPAFVLVGVVPLVAGSVDVLARR